MKRFEPNITSSTSCIDFLDCRPNQVQKSVDFQATCVDVVPTSNTIYNAETHATIEFTAMHTVDLQSQYKFVLFGDSLKDVR